MIKLHGSKHFKSSTLIATPSNQKQAEALSTCIIFFGMQIQATKMNGKVEIVNRERKYCQQNTAFELNASSSQKRKICMKNIQIQAACARIENQMEEVKREAMESNGCNLDVTMKNGSVPCVQ
ncbi:hypothetical protein ACH5RR_024917 [Cinchona calisaya]|uniref:Uncharacterized protein n=1 Tax=Cinchona calisaya TaxID=153742 RepID=A0ABD2Z1M2_9GENT